MSANGYAVVDCDGHIVESIPEMAERADLSDDDKRAVLGDNARRFFRL